MIAERKKAIANLANRPFSDLLMICRMDQKNLEQLSTFYESRIYLALCFLVESKSWSGPAGIWIRRPLLRESGRSMQPMSSQKCGAFDIFSNKELLKNSGILFHFSNRITYLCLVSEYLWPLIGLFLYGFKFNNPLDVVPAQEQRAFILVDHPKPRKARYAKGLCSFYQKNKRAWSYLNGDPEVIQYDATIWNSLQRQIQSFGETNSFYPMMSFL